MTMTTTNDHHCQPWCVVSNGDHTEAIAQCIDETVAHRTKTLSGPMMGGAGWEVWIEYLAEHSTGMPVCPPGIVVLAQDCVTAVQARALAAALLDAADTYEQVTR